MMDCLQRPISKLKCETYRGSENRMTVMQLQRNPPGPCLHFESDKLQSQRAMHIRTAAIGNGSHDARNSYWKQLGAYVQPARVTCVAGPSLYIVLRSSTLSFYYRHLEGAGSSPATRVRRGAGDRGGADWEAGA